MRTFTQLLVLAILFTCWSCSENRETEDFTLDYNYGYFPLEVGKFWIYQVDSVIFDTTAMGITVDTSITFLRETITDSFPDGAGKTVFRVERSVRSSTSGTWQVQSVWAASRTDRQAERIEDNLRFIKMVFPLQRGANWDGNQFIDPTTEIIVAGETLEIFKNWNYQVKAIDESVSLNGVNFENVATIEQANSENLIELRESKEQYAEGIGLVYKELRILDTQEINEDKAWRDKAQKGFILKQTIIEHN